ncbi:MAG: hypothetical protein WCH76_07035 [Candidatus Riflemargulisbacteria bacterium]
MRLKIVAFVENTHNSPLDQRYHELALYQKISIKNKESLQDAIYKLRENKDISSVSLRQELEAYLKTVIALIDKLEVNKLLIAGCYQVPAINAGLEFAGINNIVIGLTARVPNCCVNVNVSNSEDLVKRFKIIETEGKQMSQRILSERIKSLVDAIRDKQLLQSDVDERIERLTARRESIISLMKDSIDTIMTDEYVTNKELKLQLIEDIKKHYNPLILGINEILELLRAYSVAGAESSAKNKEDVLNAVYHELRITESRISTIDKVIKYWTFEGNLSERKLVLENKQKIFTIVKNIINNNGIMNVKQQNQLKDLTGIDFDDNYFKNINGNINNFIKDILVSKEAISKNINSNSSKGTERLNKLLTHIASIKGDSSKISSMRNQISMLIEDLQKQIRFEMNEANSDLEKQSIKEKYEPILKELKEAQKMLDSLANDYNKLEEQVIADYNFVLKGLIENVNDNVFNSEKIYSDVIKFTNILLKKYSEDNVQFGAAKNENLKSEINKLLTDISLNLKLLEQILIERARIAA